LAPIATAPKEVLVMAPSKLCHSQSMPTTSSKSCNPASHHLRKHLLLHPESVAIIRRRARLLFARQAFHWMSVRSTYRMASIICRSSLAGRSPLRCGGRVGINGSIRCHSVSVSSLGRVRCIAILYSFFLSFYHSFRLI